MSYCVNCGVKLRKSERKCPLCNTKVINPNIKEEYNPIYSDKIEKFKTINYQYVSKLIILILLILTFAVVLCDAITSKSVSWSIYVISASLYLCSHLSFALCKKIYVPLVIELLASELFMFTIAYLNNGLHWYFYLIMPFIFIVWLYVILCVYLIKNKKGNIIRKLAICFLFSSLTLIIIESEIDMYRNGIININWSIYAFLPIAIGSLVIFILSFNKKIVEEIKQRLFI